MPRNRSRIVLAFLLALPLVGACTDTEAGPFQPTAILTASPGRTDLDIPVLPEAAARTLTVVAHDDGAPSPARIEDYPEEEYERPTQQIFDPHTRTGYDPGYVWALGIHQYIGNVGAIETTVHAVYQTAHLGDFTSTRQDYTPFLTDFGQMKWIWAQARIYTDRECGLQALGESKHEAWWQFYQGTSAPVWGKARKTSQATPYNQDSCSGTGVSVSGGGSDGSVTGFVCYYLVTYDMNTGQILYADFLYCASSGEDGILV